MVPGFELCCQCRYQRTNAAERAISRLGLAGRVRNDHSPLHIKNWESKMAGPTTFLAENEERASQALSLSVCVSIVCSTQRMARDLANRKRMESRLGPGQGRGISCGMGEMAGLRPCTAGETNKSSGEHPWHRIRCLSYRSLFGSPMVRFKTPPDVSLCRCLETVITVWIWGVGR